jgi:hypothetical protein
LLKFIIFVVPKIHNILNGNLWPAFLTYIYFLAKCFDAWKYGFQYFQKHCCPGAPMGFRTMVLLHNVMHYIAHYNQIKIPLLNFYKHMLLVGRLRCSSGPGLPLNSKMRTHGVWSSSTNVDTAGLTISTTVQILVRPNCPQIAFNSICTTSSVYNYFVLRV